MQTNFIDFKISKEILRAIKDMGFEEPTPIQEMAIPPALEGKDVIGRAQTGTGKTVAFGIPVVEHCSTKRIPQAIVLAPTRELAVQIAEELNRVGRYKGIYSLPIYGGQSIDRQIRSLKKGVQIIVGTPGRVIDHLKRRTLSLREINTVVLDEADEMLNMGFINDIEYILKETPSDRQTMLFSATLPPEILRISKRYMRLPVKVSVNTEKMVVSKIKQVFYEVRNSNKITALSRIIDVEDPSLALVFCHTKKEVDEVSSKLKQMGYYAGAIHGDYTQAHRDRIIRQFRTGEIDILVATDVAARGLDISGVSHVINYSIPQNPDSYIHRIGRTGRAGKTGIAITFVTPREYKNLRLIERTARTRILRAELPTREDVRRVKLEEVKEEITELIEKGEYVDYLQMVDELSESYSLRQIAASAISALYDYDDDENETDSTVRLFVTLGKKDNLHVGELIRLITEKAHVNRQSLGKIMMYDAFSFIEVDEEVAPELIRTLNGAILNGRKIKAEPARPKNRV